ncbi:hypothetical protein C479_09653 [Halovivax asiaticus JCM 14624]|uniref:Uncharacterized protein n=1 Tax=Halovivax asiaticus JCM 14624 TaxID=1227490 RepID=M0BJL1_9EURY|nr:hypothetical protein [Halovivax asiaticus]ELZ11066.1 hypothetical protein C479_09653 [Halovivax asiaticus JCM 14624]
MARDTPVRTGTQSTTDEPLPNLVTIVGRGVPSSFEVTVDGEIEAASDDPVADGTIVSGSAAEGTIEVGITRLRFSGELATVNLVDWNGVPAPESESTPTVHVDYNVAQ